MSVAWKTLDLAYFRLKGLLKKEKKKRKRDCLEQHKRLVLGDFWQCSKLKHSDYRVEWKYFIYLSISHLIDDSLHSLDVSQY